jgi:hypothetical protein
MKTFPDETSSDPSVHAEHLQQQLSYLIGHLRQDIKRVDEPQFQVLLETSAEVLGGVKTSFQHYLDRRGPSWRPSARH